MHAPTAQRFNLVRIVLVLSAVSAASFGVAALLLTRPFAEASWEEAPPNPSSIYMDAGSWTDSVSDIPVISPFHLETDPMAGLLLVNFENDPDRIYIGLEPQFFDDRIHGRGLLVIGWRVDGRVDVFHDPALRLDPRTYGIAGKGLHVMEERSFSAARFELGPGGAQVEIEFRDLEDREIRILIRETDTRPRRPFALLAPMGDAASAPPALPLVFVHDFYFVRRPGTEVRIEIGGRAHRGDPFPLLLDGTRVHFLRYSADPFIATWNPTQDGTADVLALEPASAEGAYRAEARGVRYDVEMHGAFHEIRRMSRREGAHEVVVEFTPALPHLVALRDEVEVSGAFRISTQPSAGTVTGSWRVARRDRELHVEARPDGGWTPGDAPRTARLLFRALTVFRAWPTTYVWRGTLQLPLGDQEVQGALPLRSAWERIE